ncbi:MAG: pilus assembly protein MshP [Pseudomonadota bacterium]
MTPGCKSLCRQRGVALVTALFLTVVLASLALVAVKLVSSQSQTVSLSIQAARAFQAAQAGIEYGAHRALVAGACAPATFTYTEGGLTGITVDVSCAVSTHGEGATTTSVYSLEAFARAGAYGSPDYVSRRVRATVADST